MKYCSNCGSALEDSMNFCSSCGASVNTDEAKKAKEQNCLDRLSAGLKHERLCYKIFGIAWTVIASFILILSIFMLIGSSLIAENAVDYSVEYNGSEYYIEDFDVEPDAVASALFIGLGSGYISMALIFLGVGIVNFVLASKVGKYRNTLYKDCTNGANHASSVGSIVLAAFFNEVALIFVIINFVFMKRNAQTFESIKANQKSYNEQL